MKYEVIEPARDIMPRSFALTLIASVGVGASLWFAAIILLI